MSKLWKVEVTIETNGYAIVFADTEDEARDLARDNKDEIVDCGDSDFSTSACELENAHNLPWGWDKNDTPYGADTTIGCFFEGGDEPRMFRDVHTIDMFAGAPA